VNLQQQLLVSREAFVRTKRDMCAKYEAPYDLQPQINVVDDTGHVMVGTIDSLDQIPMAIGVLENALPGSIMFLVSLNDTLYYEAEEGEPAPKPGTLARLMESGDMRVRDALAVTVIDVLNDEVETSFVPYRYDDFGQPVFDEPQARPTLDSAVVDLLRASAASLG
jgi:hypothetical protein